MRFWDSARGGNFEGSDPTLRPRAPCEAQMNASDARLPAYIAKTAVASVRQHRNSNFEDLMTHAPPCAPPLRFGQG